MGNVLDRAHGLHILKAWRGRPEDGLGAVFLEIAKIQIDERDEPAAVLAFPDSDGLARERAGQEEAGSSRDTEVAVGVNVEGCRRAADSWVRVATTDRGEQRYPRGSAKPNSTL
jgi:hypothetical protein